MEKVNIMRIVFYKKKLQYFCNPHQVTVNSLNHNDGCSQAYERKRTIH